MNRNGFIKRLVLVGASLALAPIRIFASKATTKTFQLPNATIHIPHGNFATAEVEQLSIAELGLECSVQQFMRNGINLSKDDMKLYSFTRNDETLVLSTTRNGNTSTIGKINGLNISVNSFDDQHFSIRRN